MCCFARKSFQTWMTFFHEKKNKKTKISQCCECSALLSMEKTAGTLCKKFPGKLKSGLEQHEWVNDDRIFSVNHSFNTEWAPEFWHYYGWHQRSKVKSVSINTTESSALLFPLHLHSKSKTEKVRIRDKEREG